jgi:hypothetical protein
LGRPSLRPFAPLAARQCGKMATLVRGSSVAFAPQVERTRHDGSGASFCNCLSFQRVTVDPFVKAVAAHGLLFALAVLSPTTSN